MNLQRCPSIMAGRHLIGRGTSRYGFTLIELLIVVVVISIIFSIGAGAVLHSMAKARVANAADALGRVHREASTRAIAGKPSPGQRKALYGVAIEPAAADRPARVVLLQHGAGPDDVLMIDHDGDDLVDRPALAVTVPAGVELAIGVAGGPPAILATRLTWWYSWGTGIPVVDVESSRPIGIGTAAQPAAPKVVMPTPFDAKDVVELPQPAIPASPICSELWFRQGKNRIKAAIYALGPMSTEVL